MNVIDFFRVVPKKRVIKIKSRNGIIYHNPPTFKKILFISGNFLLVFSTMYFVYLYFPLSRAIINYKFFNSEQTDTYLSEIPTISPIVTEYKLLIPKISASSDVKANVSPFEKNEYLKVLEENVVAQAKDTAIPGSGKGNTIFIFAHSTQQGLNMVRKNSIFYLLDELKTGDSALIQYNGQNLNYRVYMKRIVNASEIEYFTFKDVNKEVLILQTCWPIGTDWKRLLVFAEKI